MNAQLNAPQGIAFDAAGNIYIADSRNNRVRRVFGFLKINERTLRYDLNKLAMGGFIRKRGTTKGVYYEPLNSQS